MRLWAPLALVKSGVISKRYAPIVGTMEHNAAVSRQWATSAPLYGCLQSKNAPGTTLCHSR